jgi:hypothetical protein
LLTEVFIPVPEASKVSGMQTDLDAVEFSSNAEVVYQHDGVGSGRFLAYRTGVFCPSTSIDVQKYGSILFSTNT